ncbi:MAG: tetratricopeptide repeat protein [Candidatus Coatesbacteria bacterium]|nr:tetratricopeptide repeat protein [Candidatus Coatesbacteria bacterium]
MRKILTVILLSTLLLHSIQGQSQEDRTFNILYSRILQMRALITLGANDKAMELAKKTNSLAHWVNTPWIIRSFYQTYGSIAENQDLSTEEIATIYNEGLKVLKRIDKLEPNNEIKVKDIKEELGNMNVYLGQLYEKKSENEKAYEFYNTAIAEDDENSYAYRVMSTMLAKNGKVDEAIKLLEKGGSIILPRDKEKSARLFNLAGVKAVDARKYQESIDLFRKAIGIYSEEPVFYTNLGFSYGQLKFFQKQEEILINAYNYFRKKNKDKSANLAYNLEEYYISQESSEKALIYGRIAINEAPDSLIYRIKLGEYLQKIKKYDAAIDLYQSGTDYYMKKENKYSAANMINRKGLVYFEQGKNKEAIDAIYKAINLNPYKAVYYTNLAYIYNKQKDYGYAISALQSGINTLSISDKRSTAEMLYMQAGIFIEMNDYESALNSAMKALNNYKLRGDYYLRLGTIYEKLNKKDEAMKIYKLGVKTLQNSSIDIPEELQKKADGKEHNEENQKDAAELEKDK